MAESVAPTVLVVDDNDIDRQCIERALSKKPMLGPATTASNGREALDLLIEHDGKKMPPKPFIILLDLNMPRMDGFEFLAELAKLEIRSYTSVFVLTTSEDESDIMNSYRHSIAGYFVKSQMGQNFEAVAQFLEQYVRVNTFLR